MDRKNEFVLFCIECLHALSEYDGYYGLSYAEDFKDILNNLVPSIKSTYGIKQVTCGGTKSSGYDPGSSYRIKCKFNDSSSVYCMYMSYTKESQPDYGPVYMFDNIYFDEDDQLFAMIHMSYSTSHELAEIDESDVDYNVSNIVKSPANFKPERDLKDLLNSIPDEYNTGYDLMEYIDDIIRGFLYDLPEGYSGQSQFRFLEVSYKPAFSWTIDIDNYKEIQINIYLDVNAKLTWNYDDDLDIVNESEVGIKSIVVK